jgi:hypothetical protein
MRVRRQGECEEQGCAHARSKAGLILEARQAAMQRKAIAQCKEAHMRHARQGRSERQVRADARGKVGQMREARQGRSSRQSRASALGKAIQIRDAS